MPTDLSSKFMLVSEHLSAGRYEQARQVLLRCIQQAPSSFEANNGMAVALTHLGQIDQALFYAERAAALNPSDSNVLNTLGSTLSTLGKHEEAVRVLERAVALAGEDPNPRLTLSNALWSLKRHADSLAILRDLQMRMPGHPEVVYRLATKEAMMVRARDGYEACRRAIELAPRHVELAKSLATTAQYVETLEPAEVVDAHRRIAGVVTAELTAAGITVPTPWRGGNTREPERKLRVGFVSPDFWAHSVAYFFEPLLDHLDRNQFHITLYSSSGITDDVTRRLRGRASAWVPVAGMPDRSLVERIAADKIDILIDLAGHSVGSRLMAMSRRAAPVQATYCGYAWTTGVPNIDYRFVDGFTDPPGAESLNSETLVRIDPCFLCYRPFDKAPTPKRSEGEPGPLFASFNVTAKLNDRVIDVWAKVLAATPGSRLLLKSLYLSDPTLRSELAARFAARGVAADRLVLHSARAAIADHLAMYNGVDVCLDPFPYAGTTTTCEALWMGVPVVTLAGKAHAGRVGVSLLSNAGLGDLVAADERSYVEIASRLAADTTRLAALRAGLRDQLRSSPLLDAPAHAARFGAALRECWRRWCVEA